jgi:multisubunit Na+/H+ antiporter MnhB subunit
LAHAFARARRYLIAMNQMFQFLVPVAMLAVLAALGFGVYAMFRGGDFGRTWSNRMMRVRVITQFVAVLVLLAALYLTQLTRGA